MGPAAYSSGMSAPDRAPTAGAQQSAAHPSRNRAASALSRAFSVLGLLSLLALCLQLGGGIGAAYQATASKLAAKVLPMQRASGASAQPRALARAAQQLAAPEARAEVSGAAGSAALLADAPAATLAVLAHAAPITATPAAPALAKRWRLQGREPPQQA